MLLFRRLTVMKTPCASGQTAGVFSAPGGVRRCLHFRLFPLKSYNKYCSSLWAPAATGGWLKVEINHDKPGLALYSPGLWDGGWWYNPAKAHHASVPSSRNNRTNSERPLSTLMSMAMSPPKQDYDFPPPASLLPPPPLLSLPTILTSGLITASPAPAPEMYVVPGIVVFERFFSVPLDYFNRSRGTIQIFVRHCVALSRQKQVEQLPFMLYLQGGPGMEASSQPPSNSGMLKVLMDKGYQILQLDQRGTGLSTPISSGTLADLGNLEDQVEYVKMFRADNIGIARHFCLKWGLILLVRDCEAIRVMMLGHRQDQRWSILGQSFGGFCAITYLSFAYLTPHQLQSNLDHRVYERSI
jgi:alpha/beta hydrolase fold